MSRHAGDGPRIAVVTFPGSNDDGDAMLALELLGAEPVRAWHADAALPDATAGVVLPGGKLGLLHQPRNL